jgi:hypothetical protein
MPSALFALVIFQVRSHVFAQAGLHCSLSTDASCVAGVRKMIFSIEVFVTLLDYLKIPQVAILGDLHV